VALVGRVNVGKSSLFNRLIEKDKAITSKIPGTTRDSNQDFCEWGEHTFIVVDTAGMEFKKESQKKELEKNVDKQINYALKKADLIYFITDVNQGVLPKDREIIKKLNKSKKNYLLIVNKADNPEKRSHAHEFYKLGAKEIFAVSAKNGTGTAELLNKTVEILFSKKYRTQRIEPDFSLAIIGKPNVGKSSLLNAILEDEQSIVSPIAHTTREPKDILIQYGSHHIKLIDTAGIRRKHKKSLELEKKSVDKALQTINEADLCLMVLDASGNIDHQDKKIIGQLLDPGSSLIFIANKKDLMDPSKSVDKLKKSIYSQFPNKKWAPILFVSAKHKNKTRKILETALDIMEKRKYEIPEKKLEKMIKKLVKKHKDQQANKKITYIYGMKQKKSNPPVFELKVHKKEHLPKALMDIIQKEIRKEFEYTGTPITLKVSSIRP